MSHANLDWSKRCPVHPDESPLLCPSMNRDKQVVAVTKALSGYMPDNMAEERSRNICQILEDGECTLNEAVEHIRSTLSPVEGMPGRISDQKLREKAMSQVLCAWILGKF